MSNLPDQESLLTTPRTSGAAQPFILTVKECWRSFVTDLDTLTRDRLQQRRQCALPISTRSTPAMMSAIPATMVRVSGSPKRSLEAIAVTATPPADQIP